MKKWIAYFALAVIVTAFSLGYVTGSEMRCYFLEWYPLQLRQVAEGNHSYSDEMVRNVVKLYAFHHNKALAFRQLDEVLKVDSAQWHVQYCRAYLLHHERRGINIVIQAYERAWRLMDQPGAAFDAGGGNIFSESELLRNLANLYHDKYTLTGNEYFLHYYYEMLKAENKQQ